MNFNVEKNILRPLNGKLLSIVKPNGQQRFSRIKDVNYDKEEGHVCIELITKVNGEVKTDITLRLEKEYAKKLITGEVLYQGDSGDASTKIKLVSSAPAGNVLKEELRKQCNLNVEDIKGSQISIGYNEAAVVYTVLEATLEENWVEYDMVKIQFTNQKTMTIGMIELDVLFWLGESLYHDKERDEVHLLKLIKR